MKELENVKILFYSGYWDGPTNGICEYENKMYWYNIIDDISVGDEDSDDFTWYRTYNVYTEFDKKLVNERFKIPKKLFFKRTWNKFIDTTYYKKRKKEHQQIDYSKNKIIGTFKN